MKINYSVKNNAPQVCHFKYSRQKLPTMHVRYVKKIKLILQISVLLNNTNNHEFSLKS